MAGRFQRKTRNVGGTSPRKCGVRMASSVAIFNAASWKAVLIKRYGVVCISISLAKTLDIVEIVPLEYLILRSTGGSSGSPHFLARSGDIETDFFHFVRCSSRTFSEAGV